MSTIRDKIATLVQEGHAQGKTSYDVAGKICEVLGECAEAVTPAGVSPSGLLRFELPGVGLAVSAAEHEHVVAKHLSTINELVVAGDAMHELGHGLAFNEWRAVVKRAQPPSSPHRAG